jgi:hypothetical protein
MKSIIVQEVHNIVETLAVVAKAQIALVHMPDPVEDEELMINSVDNSPWGGTGWNDDDYDDPEFSLSYCQVWTNLPDVIQGFKTILGWEGRKSLYGMTCFTVNTKPKNVIKEMEQHFNVTAVLEV